MKKDALTNSEEFCSAVSEMQHNLPMDRAEGRLWVRLSPRGDWVNFRMTLDVQLGLWVTQASLAKSWVLSPIFRLSTPAVLCKQSPYQMPWEDSGLPRG